VVAALQALQPLDRRILDLWFIERLTHAQIAQRLDEQPERLPNQRPLTVGAVARRHERAIRELRKLLGGEVAS